MGFVQGVRAAARVRRVSGNTHKYWKWLTQASVRYNSRDLATAISRLPKRPGRTPSYSWDCLFTSSQPNKLRARSTKHHTTHSLSFAHPLIPRQGLHLTPSPHTNTLNRHVPLLEEAAHLQPPLRPTLPRHVPLGLPHQHRLPRHRRGRGTPPLALPLLAMHQRRCPRRGRRKAGTRPRPRRRCRERPRASRQAQVGNGEADA